MDTTDNSEDSTQASTVTANSKVSAGRMSTSSARIRDLDAVLQKHKETSDLKEAKHSERVSHIERQLSRLAALESQLSDVNTDYGRCLNIFGQRSHGVVSTKHRPPECELRETHECGGGDVSD